MYTFLLSDHAMLQVKTATLGCFFFKNHLIDFFNVLKVINFIIEIMMSFPFALDKTFARVCDFLLYSE